MAWRTWKQLFPRANRRPVAAKSHVCVGKHSLNNLGPTFTTKTSRRIFLTCVQTNFGGHSVTWQTKYFSRARDETIWSERNIFSRTTQQIKPNFDAVTNTKHRSQKIESTHFRGVTWRDVKTKSVPNLNMLWRKNKSKLIKCCIFSPPRQRRGFLEQHWRANIEFHTAKRKQHRKPYRNELPNILRPANIFSGWKNEFARRILDRKLRVWAPAPHET